MLGGVAIWIAGTRLSRAIDVLTDRVKIGKAFAGALLLGGITSLPELATTLTASVGGRAEIAVNNILGGVAMQVAILAGVDAVLRRERTLFRMGIDSVLVLATHASGVVLLYTLR